MGYWEDLTRGAQAVTSDPRETATPHIQASIAPPPGVASMTPDEASSFLQDAANQRIRDGMIGLDVALKENYARAVVAADMAAMGYVAPGPEDTIGRKGTRWVMNALNWPLDQVQRGLATASAVANEATARGGGDTWTNLDSGAMWTAPFRGSVWSEAWDASKGISPGQAFFAPTDPNMGDLRTRLLEGKRLGEETLEGRLATGTADFLTNVFLDPTIIGGKIWMAASKSRNTVKAGEVADSIKAAEAAANGTKAEGVSRPATRIGQKTYEFLKSTDDKTVSQLLQMNQFKQTSDAGVLAHLFAQANEIPPGAERMAAKLKILAAAEGDPKAKAELAEKYADLNAQLTRITTAPAEGRAFAAAADGITIEIKGGKPTFTVDSSGEIAELNADVWQAELRAAEKKIRDQLALIERQQAVSGELRKIGNRWGEQVAQNMRVRSATNERVIYNSAIGQTITVIGGALDSRAPSSINIADTSLGVDDFTRALSRSKWIPKDVQNTFLSRYSAANSRPERARIVEEAEAYSHKKLAEDMGINPGHADALLQAAKAGRKEWRVLLHGRAFSGLADEAVRAKAEGQKDIVSLVGPDGTGFAYDRAFLQSQLRDTAMFMDPDAMRAAMKWAKKHRIGESLEVDPSLSAGEWAADVSRELTAAYLKFWKLSALLRIGYLPRVQIDSQMRIAAEMGALRWAATAGWGVVNTAKNYGPQGWAKTVAEDGSTKIRPRRMREDRASILSKPEEFMGVDIRPARNYDELLKVERMTALDEGTLTNALIDRTVKELSELRGSGEHDVVRPADIGWADAYLRSVNRQIRNSPVARAILDGANDETLIRLANKRSGPIHNEWMNFRDYSEIDGDPKKWIAIARSHVNTTVPVDSGIREIAAQRNITKADIEEYFENTANRMEVNGEAYVPIGGVSRTHQGFNKVARFWYKWMSDVPEQVMARQPLYNDTFRREMKDLIGRWASENPGERIPLDEVERIHKRADSLARRRLSEVLFDLEKMSPGSGLKTIIFPFFSAWEDTMKKWGKLFYNDPTIARRFTQAASMPANAGLLHKDEESRRDFARQMLRQAGEHREPTQQEVDAISGTFFYVPKSWAKAFGINISDDYVVRVDPKSFNIVFQGNPPFLPSPGPLAQIPANILVSHSTWVADQVDKNPILKWILPYGSKPEGRAMGTPFAEQLIPGWLRSATGASGTLAAFFGDNETYADNFNQILKVEWSRYYRGERDSQPTPDEIQNRVKNYYIAQAWMKGVLPVTVRPGPSEQIQFYLDQAHAIQEQYRLQHPKGQAIEPGEPTPEQIFYERYPQFFDLMISLSMNETGVEATLEAQTEAEKYSKAIAANPEIGWALAGPENLKGEHSPGIYDYQRSKKIGPGSDRTWRGKKDPLENFNEPAVRRGWMEYYKARAAVDAELDARGLKSLTSSRAKDLREALANYRKQLALAFPGWGEDYDQRDASRVEGFIAAIQDAGEQYPSLRERKDMRLLDAYIKSRQVIHEELKRRPRKSLSDPSNADLAEAWGAYVKQLTDQDLSFTYMYNRILEGDDVNKELLGVAP